MIKLLWRTDVHFSSNTPISRLDDWQETVSRKLRHVGDIARDRGVDAVLDGGDFFHIKAPTRNPHHLISATAEIHKGYPCPTYANIGNHDLSHDQLSSLHKQPLGVLFSTGVFRPLTDESFESGGVKVRVIGYPFKRQWSAADFHIERGDEDYLVVALHLLASPKRGGNFFSGEPILAYKDIPAIFPEVDLLLIGHWHQDQGVVELPNGAKVVNTGSLTRGALTEDEMTREPKVVLCEFGDQLRIEEIPIEVVAAEDVFDVEARTKKKLEETHMDDFVRRLQAQSTLEEDESLTEHVDKLNGFSDAVRQRAVYYLEKFE